MRSSLLEILRCPLTGSRLALEPFAFDERERSRIAEGILRGPRDIVYPVHRGVPIMIEDAWPFEFVDRYGERLAALDLPVPEVTRRGETWSFSDEWEAHFAAGLERTWGWTTSERVQQFLLELRVDAPWCRGKRILDAGTGNGSLAEGIAGLGADVVGVDFSTSVLHAEKVREAHSLDYVQGDLMKPPLAEESFDAAVSIGVLHHACDTQQAFKSVVALVKPGGRLYVWLYAMPHRALGRFVKLPVREALRSIVSRAAPSVQRPLVRSYARLVWLVQRVLRGGDPLPFEEYVVAAYDDLTPRWRHYHTPQEAARWFHAAGFGPPVLSHWDNPYGFGLVATKNGGEQTPGIHYGGDKLWGPDRTVIP